MNPRFHTPYVETGAVGDSRPFAIGLSKLELADWIEVDGLLESYLAEKDRLEGELPEKVFLAEPDSVTGQAEVLALLVEHLPQRFPQVYRREGAVMRIGAERRVRLDAPASAPLQIAAALVQEDLILMRKGEDGWRLAAGSLCFPSSWRLGEKFGQVMAAIHAPVPGFAAGTRNAGMIERMFDHLRVDHPVVRWNWGLHDDAALYHPYSGEDVRRFGDDADFFIRVERQTLRKLPQSGDILFTIRIHLQALSLLEQQPDAVALAAGLAGQIAALDAGQLEYKGLLQARERLVRRLGRVGSGSSV